MSSSITAPEGIINPPIDELLEATDSKYSLVIYAAKRARQINAYYSQLGEGLLEYVGRHPRPREAALDRPARDQRGSADVRGRRGPGAVSTIFSLQLTFPQARQRDCRACGV